MGFIGDALGGIFGGAGQDQQATDFRTRIDQQNAAIQNMLWGPTFRGTSDDPWGLNSGVTNPNSRPGMGGRVGLFNQQDWARGQAQRMATNSLNRYNQSAGQIGQMAQGAEGMARQFGRGANQLIDQQSARALQGANRTSLGQLAQSGLGNSTLASNQLAGNAIQSNLGNQQQKLGVQQAMTDRLMGARQNNVNTQMGLLGGRADLERGRVNLFNQNANNSIQTRLGALFQPSQTPWSNAALNQMSTGQNNNNNLAGLFGQASGGGGLGGLFGQLGGLFGF